MSTGLREKRSGAPQVTVVRLDFLAERREKNRWPLSFILAVVLHCVVLFAGHYFIVQPATYGLQGSSASMEILMIAALPEKSVPAPVPAAPEALPAAAEAESEMTVPKAPEKSLEKEAEKEPVRKEPEEAKAKGDGSVPKEPGENLTTLYSRASSETAGKEGKYRNLPPVYPSIAERNGWEGTVLLKAHIKQEGEPAEVVLVKSSGHRVLDEAALKAVRKWKFTAAEFGGKSVSSWLQIPVRFTLEDA